MDIFEKLSLIGLVPVIKIENAEDAVPLCRALKEGGLPVAEITFRTAAAEASIAAVHKELPDVLLGAGTVITCQQVDRAVAAGATYIVSPGFNPEVVRHCQQVGVPILPGCANPSDIEMALGLGVKLVKFFPAEALGGLPLVKALSAPYGDVRFVPTGGISEKNLLDYLSFGKIAACGGSWMVPESAIAAKDWGKITELTRAAVQLVLGFELYHIGINSENEQEATATAKALADLLQWPVKEKSYAYFIGNGFEVMREKGRGRLGHIGISTRFLQRAKAYLQGRGYRFDEDAPILEDGKLTGWHLADEIAGFSFHLSQR